MKFEQAVYGQVGERGHGLRQSSDKSQIAAEIYGRLDLPDSVPGGVQGWSPFVRGFPVADRYVIAKTFLDSTASRGGMVLSHALIMSLDDVCGVDSLATLFGLLATAVDEFPTLITTFDHEPAGGHDTYAPELVGAANALATQQQLPIVSVGVPGFENLVDALWQNLSPQMRRSFAFRLSFGPSDLVEQPLPTIVCTPEQLRARWTKHALVKPDDVTPVSAVAEVLCGQRPLAPLLALAGDISVALTTLKDLSRIERLHDLLAGEGEFDDLVWAVRLVDGLSADPKVGAASKSALLDKLVVLAAGASVKHILVMRNLLLAGFAKAEQLWSAVEHAVSTFKFEPAEDAELSDLAQAAVDADLAFAPWRGAVTAGLLTAGRKDGAPIFKAAWRWAETSPPAFSAVLDVLPAEPAFERRLADVAPKKLHVAKLDSLLAPLLKKRWLVAHGVVLAATLPPRDAARQQLKVDKAIGSLDGLKSALSHASPAQLLECAVAEKDTRLVAMAADAAVSDPRVLSGIRGQEIIEQQVWSAAIKKKPSLWDAPNKPAQVRDTVLTQLLEDQPVESSLLDVLAQTPLADVSLFPRRAELWLQLPQRDAYLRATAAGWLDEAVKRGKVAAPDTQLERAIITSAQLEPVLTRATVAVDTRLAIVGALASFTEDMFVAWLVNMLRSSSRLPAATSEQIGTLIAMRRWERAARYLGDRLREHRQDLLPALQKCAGLLGPITRWLLGISVPTVSEKWAALEEAACDLYPSGPDLELVWSSAGGKLSELPSANLSGAARWRKALSFIRIGGRPHPHDLLAQMCRDYPRNEQLRLYASDSDIVGRR
ncbi:effector-associated domain EAD1-containing protein [Delftia tsuruhatensis]|uniref:GAP1-N1 domain-containing protein n=1 Tax=Delftia tsuruhatensis TaxID=180282 RepID=UPI0002E57D5B|nr:effector-associated domain EAD1-containing protein [Delftia tsuruhatensis]MDH0849476.1 effector-associated domain EAD1-containing protein [Delftia tsuruhatensis]